MRAYYLPMCAGFLLAGSAFMPWILIGDNALGGLPSISGFWVLALAIVVVVLASLSVITRKNSRHPLLVVGLAAFAIVLLSEQWMQRAAVDEIDAALDDQNVGRLVELLTEFSAQTQFLVITHNKRTAAGAANLFGVTMEENGVSRLVTLRLPAAERTTAGEAVATGIR